MSIPNENKLLSPFRDVMATIRRRRSCRAFASSPLDATQRAHVQRLLQALPPPPFGSPVALHLVDRAGIGVPKLGTYGVIKGAQHYLAGAASSQDLEAYGYVLEWMILAATELGLGTCWLGGTLTRDSFAEAVGATSSQDIPAVTPIGVPSERRTLVDSTFRYLAGSDQRKPWERLFFRNAFDTPLTRQDAGSWAEVLEAVRLAPSASNKQPWRIVRSEDGAWQLFLRRTAGYGRMMSVDLQRLDLGIALCHFDLAAKAKRLAGRWQVLGAGPSVGSLPEDTSYVATWA